MRKSASDTMKELIEFCKKNDRLPQPRNGGDELRLYDYMRSHSENKNIIKIKSDYRVRAGHSLINIEEYGLKELEEFCILNNRIPDHNMKGESRLSRIMNFLKDNPKVKELKSKYCKRKVRL